MSDLATLDSAWKRSFRRQLLKWYERHARELPWRTSSDPYRVWVSEVMLQQTQVETVREYFKAFMAEFPTVADLAAAREQKVLKLWEGLGYYRRARSLHAAAKVVVAEHAGRMPSDVETLMTLPGVGRYTAGAIVSIAFDKRAPILEANTIRLYSRLIALAEDPTKAAGQRALWAFAEEVLPQKDVARFNQALMELGSLVCRPKQPKCDECPVHKQCRAYADGVIAQLKPTTTRVKFSDLEEAVVVVRHNGKYLMRQCAENERWAGLWDFPRFATDAESAERLSEEIIAKVEQMTGVKCLSPEPFHKLKHGVTRYRITLTCYEASRVGGRIRNGACWRSTTELKEMPLSVTGRKIAKLLST